MFFISPYLLMAQVPGKFYHVAEVKVQHLVVFHDAAYQPQSPERKSAGLVSMQAPV
jgi:hypothetical protein